MGLLGAVHDVVADRAGGVAPLLSAAAARSAAAAFAALGLFVSRHLDDLETNVLKGELFTNAASEVGGFLVRLMHRAQLNLDGFSDELREGLDHFSIKDEGKIGVEFFLKLMELGLIALPGTVFIHGENELVRSGIVGKGVKNAGIFESVH